MKKIMIFTDLDGTLLDAETYDFTEALPALRELVQREIPVIFCSSKTRREIEFYRTKMGNNHPFISENGGGIFIPSGYLDETILNGIVPVEKSGDYNLITLGAKYDSLRLAIQELKQEGFSIKGFGDMTVAEITNLTGLSREEAVMARERDFDEPFVFAGTDEDFSRLLQSIIRKGFRYTIGRLHHLMGESDKGKAVSLLAELFRRIYGDIVTIGLGDSVNDVPMLEVVDFPILVKMPGGSYNPGITLQNIYRADGVGPSGWRQAVLSLIDRLRS